MRESILAYERTGKQDSDITLIFLHGSTMTKEGMLPLAEAFRDYNCVVFDLTAHGQSDGEEPEEIAVFAEDVEYSIRQLQQQKKISEKMILLGFSMGGAITCEIAIRNNIKLTGMVLLSSAGNLKDYTPLVESLKEMPVEQFKTEDILAALFGTDTPASEKERLTQAMTATKAADAVGYGDLMASHRYDRLDACKDIAIPAMLIHGNDDKIVLPTAAIETWKTIKNSELLMLPYKGHAAIYEEPDFVRDKIISFVKMCAIDGAEE